MNLLKGDKKVGFKGNKRVGEEHINYQGCPMTIVEYISNDDIFVEFQDKYKAKVHTQYVNFQKGSVKNPYYPSVYGVGITGNKYPASINKKRTKEYDAWQSMLIRCYDNKTKEKYPTYQDVTCCEEWLMFENFYEWLHEQSNFDKWLNNKDWALDKDIIVKNNKVYSPETCCLVPQNVNKLLVRKNSKSGLPIGVRKKGNRFSAKCQNPFTGKSEYIGMQNTPEQAFYFGYKPYKETIIKQVAQEEYDKGNITEKCYEAMMSYEVEIDD